MERTFDREASQAVQIRDYSHARQSSTLWDYQFAYREHTRKLSVWYRGKPNRVAPWWDIGKI